MKKYLQFILLLFAISISHELSGQTLLITNPVNGHYCSGTSGVQILIQESAPGQPYALRKTGTAGNQATLTGTGNTEPFPGTFPAGEYFTIPATSIVTVVLDPLPTAQTFSTVPADGKFCNYPGAAGIEIRIAGSQAGVDYELFLGPAPGTSQGIWTGNGAPHSFGYFTVSGVYFVIAKFPLTGCTRNLGNVSVISNTPPIASFSYLPPSAPPVCASTPIQFSGSSTGSGLVWHWHFNDPKSGTNNSSS
ncbi:MAG: hypothetical protein WCI71_13315, partial [Bacteroidota bacterium]